MKIPVRYYNEEGETGGGPGMAPEVKEKNEDRAAAPAPEDQSDRGGTEDWKAMYVRLLADFDNFRKHARAERERLAEVGKESVISDIIPVIEHLERAQQAAAGDAAIFEGLRVVLAEFFAALKRHGVERVPTVGEPFDPSRHEAVAVVPAAGVEENTVVEEVRPGFMRDGRLLRPASVVVAQ